MAFRLDGIVPLAFQFAFGTMCCALALRSEPLVLVRTLNTGAQVDGPHEYV